MTKSFFCVSLISLGRFRFYVCQIQAFSISLFNFSFLLYLNIYSSIHPSIHSFNRTFIYYLIIHLLITDLLSYLIGNVYLLTFLYFSSQLLCFHFISGRIWVHHSTPIEPMQHQLQHIAVLFRYQTQSCCTLSFYASKGLRN